MGKTEPRTQDPGSKALATQDFWHVTKENEKVSDFICHNEVHMDMAQCFRKLEMHSVHP